MNGGSVGFVRPATQADAESIARIHVDAWRHNYRGLIDDATLALQRVETRLLAWNRALAEGVSVLLAEDEGEVRGWVSLGAFRHSASTRPEVMALTTAWAELMGFYVAPTAQRTGIGRTLWNAAKAWCFESGYQDVGLWVLANNAPAIRFYEACGFCDQRLDQHFEINGQPLVESLLARRL